MLVGFCDWDLIERLKIKTYRLYPSLEILKQSAYHIIQRDRTKFLTEPSQTEFAKYDKLYLWKHDAYYDLPEWLGELDNIEYYGRSFKKTKLPLALESIYPDYDLYREWTENQILTSPKWIENFRYFADYSLGKLTDSGAQISNVSDFKNKNTTRALMYDRHFLKCQNWKELWTELNENFHRIEWVYGFNLNDMTGEQADFFANYMGNEQSDVFTYWDRDSEVREKQLKTIARLNLAIPRARHIYIKFMYGRDENKAYDKKFWRDELEYVLSTIRDIIEYGGRPYLSHYPETNISDYRYLMNQILRWTNLMGKLRNKSYEKHMIDEAIGIDSPRPRAYLDYIQFMKDWPDFDQSLFQFFYREIYKTKTEKYSF